MENPDIVEFKIDETESGTFHLKGFNPDGKLVWETGLHGRELIELYQAIRSFYGDI